MKIKFHLLSLFVLLSALALQAAPPDSPILPYDMKAMIGRGFDVSWAEFNKNINGYGEDEVIALQEKGFKNARIRTKLPADATLFSYLDRCVNDCLNHDVIPIIAHNAGEYELNPTYANMQADSIWWATVAEHFKDYSHKLIFNINIEWSDAGGKDAAGVNNYYKTVTPGIRRTNPTRILIYSPIKLSSPEYLTQMVIPASAGSYVMAEWHLYAAGPSSDPASPKYWSTGTAAEKKVITDEINIGAQWEKNTGIPTWVGAWMAGNYNKGNTFSAARQADFARFMVSEFERVNVPWSINASDNYYDYTANQWIDSMKVVLDVLSPMKTPTNMAETKNRVLMQGDKLIFGDSQWRNVMIYSLNGTLEKNIRIQEPYCELNTATLSENIYIVTVYENGKKIFSEKYFSKK